MRFPVLPLVKRDDYARPPPFVSVAAEIDGTPGDHRASVSLDFRLKCARSMDGERHSDVPVKVTVSWWPQARHQDTTGVALQDHVALAVEKALGGPAGQGLVDALAGELAGAMSEQRKENLNRDLAKIPRAGGAHQFVEGDITRPCYADTGRPMGGLWIHDARGLVRDLQSPASPGDEWMRPNVPEEFVRRATDTERIANGLAPGEDEAPAPVAPDVAVLRAASARQDVDPEAQAHVLRSLRRRGLLAKRADKLVVTKKGRAYLKARNR